VTKGSWLLALRFHASLKPFFFRVSSSTISRTEAVDHRRNLLKTRDEGKEREKGAEGEKKKRRVVVGPR
jgi:hypothetical protein